MGDEGADHLGERDHPRRDGPGEAVVEAEQVVGGAPLPVGNGVSVVVTMVVAVAGAVDRPFLTHGSRSTT
jgi:hypothetical protein